MKMMYEKERMSGSSLMHGLARALIHYILFSLAPFRSIPFHSVSISTFAFRHRKRGKKIVDKIIRPPSNVFSLFRTHTHTLFFLSFFVTHKISIIHNCKTKLCEIQCIAKLCQDSDCIIYLKIVIA